MNRISKSVATRKSRQYLIALLGLTISFSAPAQSVEQVYLIYCSVCHGQRMEGGRATPLVKDSWKYGSDRASIAKNIRNGIPSTQMPRWDNVLSAGQIDALADYILKAQKQKENASKRTPETNQK